MEFLPIGYFTKTHGVKGHLILKLEANCDLQALNALFIEGATGKAPYFISEFKETNNGVILKLEDVDGVEKAKALAAKSVFVESKFVVEEEEETNWINFELIDAKLGSLGLIKGVSSNGFQELVSLDYKGREIILPLVEAFIDKVDDDLKKIWYKAPDGLVDLYLEQDKV